MEETTILMDNTPMECFLLEWPISGRVKIFLSGVMPRRCVINDQIE
jgi:hypothetical protein